MIELLALIWALFGAVSIAIGIEPTSTWNKIFKSSVIGDGLRKAMFMIGLGISALDIFAAFRFLVFANAMIIFIAWAFSFLLTRLIVEVMLHKETYGTERKEAVIEAEKVIPEQTIQAIEVTDEAPAIPVPEAAERKQASVNVIRKPGADAITIEVTDGEAARQEKRTKVVRPKKKGKAVSSTRTRRTRKPAQAQESKLDASKAKQTEPVPDGEQPVQPEPVAPKVKAEVRRQGVAAYDEVFNRVNGIDGGT